MKERNEILKQRNVLMEKILSNRGAIPSGRDMSEASLRPPVPEENYGVEYLEDSDDYSN